jgi:hypothetical protein
VLLPLPLLPPPPPLLVLPLLPLPPPLLLRLLLLLLLPLLPHTSAESPAAAAARQRIKPRGRAAPPTYNRAIFFSPTRRYLAPIRSPGRKGSPRRHSVRHHRRPPLTA